MDKNQTLFISLAIGLIVIPQFFLSVTIFFK